MVIILTFSACAPSGVEYTQDTTAEITTEEVTTEDVPDTTEGESLSTEEQILEDRRNTVVEYMRNMVSVLWRAEKDIDYTLSTGVVMSIKAGRIYSGIPYTYGCGTNESFLEYVQAPDCKVYADVVHKQWDQLTEAEQAEIASGKVSFLDVKSGNITEICDRRKKGEAYDRKKQAADRFRGGKTSRTDL